VSEIRIYIEGGGDSKDTKAFLRQGMSAFLSDLVSEAREKRLKWNLVVCGGRNATFDAFQTSVKQNPGAFNVLLVDSECPVQNAPWVHLHARDHWECPLGVTEDHCQLMVQTMEAWFIADLDTLAQFYGAGFYANSIPKNPDVEQIPKSQLEPSLKAATRNTKKGEYRKIHHAARLLELINAEKVRTSSHHCNRLFEVIRSKLNE
jgi:hypothetical protein